MSRFGFENSVKKSEFHDFALYAIYQEMLKPPISTMAKSRPKC